MRRALIIAGAVILVLAAAVWAYVRFLPRPAPQRGDPVLATALALFALERTSDQQITKAQITTIVPLLRVLRDSDPNDAAVSKALVEQIRKTLTPEQVATLERMREQAHARRQQSGQGAGPPPGIRGPGGGPFGPPGGTPSPTELRRRALNRLINYLESRLNSP